MLKCFAELEPVAFPDFKFLAKTKTLELLNNKVKEYNGNSTYLALLLFEKGWIIFAQTFHNFLLSSWDQTCKKINLKIAWLRKL